MTRKRNLLRLKSLRFVSLVDVPANEHSIAIVKNADVSATARIVKIDETLNVLIGFANVSTVDGEGYTDLQDDITNEEELLKVCLEYAEAGAAVDQMHDEQQVDGARTVFLFPLTSELAKSLGIGDVQRTGILIGVKVPPEVTERARKGEINGFSIGAIGTREPLEKSADKLEALKAKADEEARKAAADIAENERLALGMIEHCNEIAKRDGIEAARRVATANVASINEWGKRWLDANPATAAIEKSGPEPTTEQIIKAFVATADTAQKHFDAIIEKRMKERKLDRARATVSLMDERAPEFVTAYAELDKARRAKLAGPQYVSKALDTEEQQLEAGIAKAKEAFSLAHNVDASAALDRLLKISPTFKADYHRAYAIKEERRHKQDDLTVAWNKHLDTKAATQKRDEEAAARAESRKHMPPSERKLYELADKHAEANGISVNKAVVELLKSDEDARKLYAAAQNEKRN